jgi:hypothetical protein
MITFCKVHFRSILEIRPGVAFMLSVIVQEYQYRQIQFPVMYWNKKTSLHSQRGQIYWSAIFGQIISFI